MKIKYEANINEIVASDTNGSFATLCGEFYICGEQIFKNLLSKFSNLATIESSVIDGGIKLYFDPNDRESSFNIGYYKIPHILFKESWYGPSCSCEFMVNKLVLKMLGFDHPVIKDSYYLYSLEKVKE